MLTNRSLSTITLHMIGRLTGVLIGNSSDDSVLIDVGGVGYELAVPTGTVGRIRSESQTESGVSVTLYVHTHFRENSLDLYGFSSLRERLVFRLLMTVSGVGPRLALGIMSAFETEQLAHCIQSGDIKGLSSAPGVGKKTAERLVLELKDKLTFAITSQPVSSHLAQPSDAASTVAQQVVEGLVRLGFRASEAQQAVTSVTKNTAQSRTQNDVKVLFREALTLLRQ